MLRDSFQVLFIFIYLLLENSIDLKKLIIKLLTTGF